MNVQPTRRYPRAVIFVAGLIFAVALGPAFAAERFVEPRWKTGETADAGTQGPVKAALQPGLAVSGVFLSDNVDNDGWADTGETVGMAVALYNRTGSDLSGVTLRLTSDDPSVGCITLSRIYVNSVPAGSEVISSERFAWIVSPTVARTDAAAALGARLTIHITVPGLPDTSHDVTVDLDLDAAGGAGPTSWFEGFEGGFGAFTTMHLDEHLNPPHSDLANRAAGVINADGARCQYNDPEWEGSSSFGNGAGEQCFPNPNGAADAFWFAVTSDRAFSGASSLRWNTYLNESLGYTIPTAQLEAVRTTDPVNLGFARVCSLTRGTLCQTDLDCPIAETCDFAAPRLSLKHQISLVDHRSINAAPERTSERGIVAIQLADAEGDPVGDWVKAYPFLNVYDSQANSNFFSCSFDPIDDGNTEGDFFDPTDPGRFQGPSSTCAPEFSFAHQGDTDEAFDPAETGDAAGPGLDGVAGIGTWVEPVIDLSRYRGRRLRLRLLNAGRKVGGAVTYQQIFAHNPDPGDDGWWVDNITVTDTLVEPATLAADLNENLGLAVCEDFFCGQAGGVQAVVEVTPDGGTSAPGRVVVIDAGESTVDVCVNGTLQYKFWVDTDGNGAFHPGMDVLLRDWSYEPSLADTPSGATRYGVAVRCETAPECSAAESIIVAVNCPGAGDGQVDHRTPFLHGAPLDRRGVRVDGSLLSGDKQATLLWTTEAMVDVVRGNLSSLRSSGVFGFSESCVVDNQTSGTSVVDLTATPGDGDALFWLLRSAESCNDPGAGGSFGGIGESVTRDTISACPD